MRREAQVCFPILLVAAARGIVGTGSSAFVPHLSRLTCPAVKWLSLVLVALVGIVQYPLWLGKGGWLRVWDVDQQIATQRETNGKLKARNVALDAEVRDLKQGLEAIEERARSELGMIRQDEIFFQVLEEAGRAPKKPQ
ncbi:MAG: septum formation initiator [Betaproteobacteria bacterium]|nr:septum formation initiator [Betaproteobacteria bacterium]